ncbi:MAG: Hsp20/alpha crystallin family protein [Burkholderiales bacterium]|nr:Hsp20/alpha crystallin family protein [Burkholderiales bacterium]
MTSRYPVPYSSQRSLGAFDPLSDFRRDMDRLFDAFFSGGGPLVGGSSAASAMSMPRIDVREDEHELSVSADLPGMKPSEVDLRLEGDVLVISGERKSEAERKDENFHVMERGYGRFRRSVQLPFAPEPEQVHADYNHGVLTIRGARIRRRQYGTGHWHQRPGAEHGTAGRQEGGAARPAPLSRRLADRRGSARDATSSLP